MDKTKTKRCCNTAVVKAKIQSVKEFYVRESLLTEILKDKHVAVVYNIFAAVFLGTCINSIVYNYLNGLEITTSLVLIIRCFKNVDICILVWSCTFLSTMGVFCGFKCWAQLRLQFIPKSIPLFLWDKFWISCFMLYIVGLLYFSATAVIQYNFGVACSIATLSETTRHLMKVYAFTRTSAPRFLGSKNVKYSPTFFQYLYFLFAPTLIYQDEYPRTKGNIRWRLVATYFLEVLGTIYFCAVIFDQSYIVALKDYGIKPYRWIDIALIIFQHAGQAMLTFLIYFYIVLHLWQNAFAEMLKFSDRQFYTDWWTSSSYGRYYRTWNCVVHNWLYTFVYKDFYEIVSRNQIVAKIMVFFVSTLFHEFIISVSVGFFLPTFIIQFLLFGTILSFVKFKNDTFGNVFLWYSLGLGNSMMYTFNLMEYYSRINCANETVLTFESFFSPKLFVCNFG